MTPSLSGSELLRALQSGRGSNPVGGTSKVGVETLDFEAMLKRVKAEGFHSGLGVTVAPDPKAREDAMAKIDALLVKRGLTATKAVSTKP